MFNVINMEKTRFVKKSSWFLHHDNAPACNALSICEFLAKNNINVLNQLPYSLDLAPCNFFLFPKLKEVIKGMHFEVVEAIKGMHFEVVEAIKRGCDKGALSNPARIPPKVHKSVAEEDGQVYQN